METTPVPISNTTLTEALAGIVCALRARPGPAGEGVALRLSSDRFVAAFLERLRFGEESVLPALRRADAGGSRPLEALERDHERLRGFAGELSRRIRDEGAGAAYGLSRSLLAALLEHFERERKETRRITDALSVRAARRLRESIRNWPSTPTCRGERSLDS